MYVCIYIYIYMFWPDRYDRFHLASPSSAARSGPRRTMGNQGERETGVENGGAISYYFMLCYVIVCVCVCIYIYTHTYTHIFICTYIHIFS